MNATLTLTINPLYAKGLTAVKKDNKNHQEITREIKPTKKSKRRKKGNR